jgi:hypothetical protein
MDSINRKSPEVNQMLNMSVASIISNPIPDDELLTIEGDKKLNIILICIVVDLILTLLIILQEYDFLKELIKTDILLFFIKSIICILLLGLVIFLYCLHKFYIAIIARFSYLIVGIIYYISKFILKLLDLFKEDEEGTQSEGQEAEELEYEINIIDIIFLTLHLLTIIPRILAFYFCRGYIEKLRKLRQIRIEEEHDNFVEKIASRIENGYTRWSNPKASFSKDTGKPIKQYFDKKEDHINDSNESE